MRKYISDYDKLLLSKFNQDENRNFIITEEFDQRIYELCKQKEEVRKVTDFSTNIPWYRKVVAAMVLFVAVISAGIVTNAATEGKVIDFLGEIFGAVIVNDETCELVGKEIVDREAPIVGQEDSDSVSVDSAKLADQLAEQSYIVEAFDDELLLPVSIEEFKVMGENVPELIMTNGAAAVFYQNEYEGWECQAGDTLVFDFRKYESEVAENQTLVVGHIRDGVMYNSEEAFTELGGKYELKIEEDGEYHIYIISATSDYLTIKEGRIWVE